MSELFKTCVYQSKEFKTLMSNIERLFFMKRITT